MMGELIAGDCGIPPPPPLTVDPEQSCWLSLMFYSLYQTKYKHISI